jgi:very-short-patch-repair endonuclease
MRLAFPSLHSGVGMRPEVAILRLAERQHFVFTLTQAAEAGISGQAVRRLAAHGQLASMHRSVYALATHGSTWESRVIAACLACGEQAVASYESAAMVWDLTDRLDVPHVTIPHASRKSPKGISVHRTRHLEVMTRRGFPVTPLMRTVLDLADIWREEQVEVALDKAHGRGMIQPERFLRYLDRDEHRNRDGSAMLRELVAMRVGSSPIGSVLETMLFAALRRVGLPLPVRQHRVTTPSGNRYIDLSYPDHRLAIELDGFEDHGKNRAVFNDDRIRQNELAAMGWDFRRFTWTNVKVDAIGSAIVVGRALGLVPTRWKKG